MAPELRLRAKSLDPALIGSRLRQARVRSGLTQGEVAGEGVSTAYISRIESGSRRASPSVLMTVADRLGVSLDALLAPEPDESESEATAGLRLQLDYAELELRTGSVEQALVGSEAVASAHDATPDLRRQAMQIRALALEASGQYDKAIMQLEDLAVDGTDPLFWIQGLIALTRCYRDTGDLNRACEIAGRTFERIEELGLSGTDEAVRLSVTVASAYFERGDVSHAIRLCHRALEVAEELGTDSARAAAYWNSSLMEAERGHVASALPMAKKAIALLEQGGDARNVARLRAELGFMQLRSVPPEPTAALDNLQQSLDELSWTSASPSEVVRARIGVAQGMFLMGRVDEAERLLTSCLQEASDSPLIRASALVLQARIALGQQRTDEAVGILRLASGALTAAGSDRVVAQVWYEVAMLLEQQGAVSEALAAYRSAAASTGLCATTEWTAPVSIPTPSHATSTRS